MKNLITIFPLFLVLFLFSSCGGDDVDCTGTSFTSGLTAEFNALSSAATAYSLDPTNSSNCEAYKDALKNYFEALEPYKSCATNAQEEAEIEDLIQEAQDDVDLLEC